MNAQQSNGPGIGGRPEGQSFRVLVVDDSEIDREIIIRHIRSAWPFEALAWESAVDGHGAMSKLAQESFSVVVLKWQLPTLHGVNVLRKLRADGVSTPVIVVSDLERGEIDDDLESLGAAYLTKENIDPTTLRDAMAISARWLTNRQEHRCNNGEREL
jgi:two-component system chemotaxis response regulator CheY